MKKNFMLNSRTAVELYEKYAKDAEIYDYHCHLSPKEIYEDKVFDDITSIWLGHDHYKWRAMRFAGVPENYVTGDVDGFERFKVWARVCGRLIGSPLYHWSNMELQKYFGVEAMLDEDSASEIYHHCNDKIEKESLSPVKMIEASNVKLVCTTDDPVDNLEYHKLLAEKDLSFKVLPTFRPDNALNIDKAGYRDYILKLSEASRVNVDSYSSFKAALSARVDYFNEVGCVLSDHSLEYLALTEQNEEEIESIFEKALNDEMITCEDAQKFKNQTLVFLANEYSKNNWVMQLHIGALRNNNKQKFDMLGGDSGFDIMNDFQIASQLSSLLGQMNDSGKLPKTILYTLNSKDNLVLSTLPHCFPEDNITGKVQFGAPWWFNDHKEGFLSHFQSIANQGMLADFIGMLTDSRSFLSYARHDYFRRILCDYIGDLVESGEFDCNMKILGDIVEGICCNNIKKYLGVD